MLPSPAVKPLPLAPLPPVAPLPPPPLDPGIRLIVAWKLAKGVVLAVLAPLLATALASGTALRSADRAAAWLAHEGTSALLRDLSRLIADHVTARTVSATVVLFALDAALSLVEGAGLARRRRWAAWLTVAATSALIPIEAWRLATRPRWGRLAVLVGNSAIAVYMALKARRHDELWARKET